MINIDLRSEQEVMKNCGHKKYVFHHSLNQLHALTSLGFRTNCGQELKEKFISDPSGNPSDLALITVMNHI